MARLFLLIITANILINSATAGCGPNEVETTNDANCVSDCCPEPKGQSVCKSPCGTGCTCAFNHMRAPNGTCIETRQCPDIPCGKNETYNKCPPNCSEKCAAATEDGTLCSNPLEQSKIILKCKPECRCEKYCWRNDDDVCVPYKECFTSQDNYEQDSDDVVEEEGSIDELLLIQ